MPYLRFHLSRSAGPLLALPHEHHLEVRGDLLPFLPEYFEPHRGHMHPPTAFVGLRIAFIEKSEVMFLMPCKVRPREASGGWVFISEDSAIYGGSRTSCPLHPKKGEIAF